jgi:CDP-glucose 4,6-dehydratase
MENLVEIGRLFAGKRVWVSGVTGFKGSWLAEWLLTLGAEVHGLSLAPETTPALFQQLSLDTRLKHSIGDIRDPQLVRDSIARARPDFVFHLAAQALVRRSYGLPVETWQTNVLGTIHVLEALREVAHPCAAVLVTTDKCYENREWHYGYREEDPLGGYDPYSSSKAGAEIAIAAWRKSFFRKHLVRVASGRAGNVFGGGDWAEDRLVPDAVRALQAGLPIPVRNPAATRPWQHVLEPLSGYLTLAAWLATHPDSPALESAFNFGPNLDSNRTVAELVRGILAVWPGDWQDRSDPHAPHEAGQLHLATDKAHHMLGWSPRWTFNESIHHAIEWYRTANDFQPEEHQRFIDLTRAQIERYVSRGLSS